MTTTATAHVTSSDSEYDDSDCPISTTPSVVNNVECNLPGLFVPNTMPCFGSGRHVIKIPETIETIPLNQNDMGEIGNTTSILINNDVHLSKMGAIQSPPVLGDFEEFTADTFYNLVFHFQGVFCGDFARCIVDNACLKEGLWVNVVMPDANQLALRHYLITRGWNLKTLKEPDTYEVLCGSNRQITLHFRTFCNEADVPFDVDVNLLTFDGEAIRCRKGTNLKLINILENIADHKMEIVGFTDTVESALCVRKVIDLLKDSYTLRNFQRCEIYLNWKK